MGSGFGDLGMRLGSTKVGVCCFLVFGLGSGKDTVPADAVSHNFRLRSQGRCGSKNAERQGHKTIRREGQAKPLNRTGTILWDPQLLPCRHCMLKQDRSVPKIAGHSCSSEERMKLREVWAFRYSTGWIVAICP